MLTRLEKDPTKSVIRYGRFVNQEVWSLLINRPVRQQGNSLSTFLPAELILTFY
jgi:hypothetical protein